tara:strand:+ start:541 stop:957 length:417 start_codon:yes stop_codon:yes gene_type:complete
LKKKLSKKDKKDWEIFINSKEKIQNKDLSILKKRNENLYRVIDLHGLSLEEANKIINDFIEKCYLDGIDKINIITGKGSRSKNKDDPYQSVKLGILKYSIPDYIKSNINLMKKIKEIDYNSIDNPNEGSFNIFLKKNK